MVPAKVGSCNTPVVSTTKITLAPDAEFTKVPKVRNKNRAGVNGGEILCKLKLT